MKIRHVNEHAIYVTETDGFHLDRFKAAYAKEYGLLTFVADHSLVENCDTWGSGDAGVYPGAAADTWDAVPPDQRRRSNEIRDCDSHHNAAGYSGTDGNALWIHDNDFYDNTLGFTTDVFTAPGHPGFPQDSDLIENNNFFSNNFNLYLRPCNAGEKPGPYGPEPGLLGRRPDGPRTGRHRALDRGRQPQRHPEQPLLGQLATRDDDLRGPRPARLWPGRARRPGPARRLRPDEGPALDLLQQRGLRERHGAGARRDQGPNGVDFWWDDFASNTGNCWHDNTGVNGDRASLKPSRRWRRSRASRSPVSCRRTAPAASGQVDRRRRRSCSPASPTSPSTSAAAAGSRRRRSHSRLTK